MSTDTTAPTKIRELEVRCARCGADAGIVVIMEDGSLTNGFGATIDQPLCGDCSFATRYANARDHTLRTNYDEIVADPDQMATLLSDMAFLIYAIERQVRDERGARKALEARLTDQATDEIRQS